MYGKLAIGRAPLQKAPNKIYGTRGRKSLLLPALLLDSTLELGFMFDCPVKYSPVGLHAFITQLLLLAKIDKSFVQNFFKVDQSTESTTCWKQTLHNQMFFTLRGIILKYVPRAIKQVLFYCFWVPASFVLTFWPYCAILHQLFQKERTVPCNFWSFACWQTRCL